MLRLDPGDGRVNTARQFNAWEGGGEYNVARGLRRCFELKTAVVTAFADNPIGRLVEDFILQVGSILPLYSGSLMMGLGVKSVTDLILQSVDLAFAVRAAQLTVDIPLPVK